MLSEDSWSRDGGGGGETQTGGGQTWPRGDGGQAQPGLGRTPTMLDATGGTPLSPWPVHTPHPRHPPHDMADAGGRMEVESRGSNTLVPSVGL